MRSLSGILVAMGITPNYVAYKYLGLAIVTAYHDMSLLTKIIKGIYPSVAEACGVSAESTNPVFAAASAMDGMEKAAPRWNI